MRINSPFPCSFRSTNVRRVFRGYLFVMSFLIGVDRHRRLSNTTESRQGAAMVASSSIDPTPKMNAVSALPAHSASLSPSYVTGWILEYPSALSFGSTTLRSPTIKVTLSLVATTSAIVLPISSGLVAWRRARKVSR